jgi:hypothetical protein
LKEKKPYKNYSQYCSIDLPETWFPKKSQKPISKLQSANP